MVLLEVIFTQNIKKKIKIYKVGKKFGDLKKKKYLEKTTKSKNFIKFSIKSICS